MTNPIENSEEVRRRSEANRPFTKLSRSDNLGLKKRLPFRRVQ